MFIDNDRDLGHDIPPKAPEPAEAVPQRVYITRQTLEKMWVFSRVRGLRRSLAALESTTQSLAGCELRVQ